MKLTKEEIEVLVKVIDHRIWQLEDCDLKDSYCYPQLLSIRHKLSEYEG